MARSNINNPLLRPIPLNLDMPVSRHKPRTNSQEMRDFIDYSSRSPERICTEETDSEERISYENECNQVVLDETYTPEEDTN